ncbi:hypothetical protein EV363DRAFT_1224135 [Boletus edulis]|uniref:Uncharacterized protein n=1 Tax=Boletus edulis BED1 TaxID=1328754 RepID=A0AAD4BCQ5_BOLED|nr:hypothetical protein EV363DRAFT_1224135 [Boletus edulis]KAF8419057.1 hypothetical protein L210DRAFT_939142 [Boletus edulis BED1]
MAASSPIQQLSYLHGSQTPYAWYINASQNAIAFAPDNTFSLGWNIRNTTEVDPLFLNPCCNNSGNEWFLINTPNPLREPESHRAWRTAARVFIGLFAVLLLVQSVRIVRSCRRR